MDYVLPFPLLLFSLLLCLLSLILFKTKTDHSKATPSSPPGPWPLPFIGNLHHIIGSLPHQAMCDLSRQYGPLMLLRLGEIPTIIVSSPDAAREIMKTHDITFATRPISTTIGIFTFGGKGIIFPPYGEYWRQLRKICVLELLSTKQVQSYRSIREEEVGNLIKYLLSCASHCQLADLSKTLSAMMNDIAARAIFGSKCKNQDVFLRELDVSLKLGAGFNLADLFPSSWLTRFVSTAVKEAERCQQAKNHFFDGVIEQHRERTASTGEGEVEGLLGLLLRIYDEGAHTNPLDMETIKAVINVSSI